jgi:succinyl-CoA synthetase alpha subunit
MTVQYRIIHGKKDEHVIGPDDADVVISIEAADVAMDPNVAYMRGKLKVVGHTGKFFDALKSGEVAAALKTERS